MDFMKWINSLDELLYEVTSWLLFFPLTLWRSTLRPIWMMDYVEAQLALPEKEQFDAALSPPLFLALALLFSDAFSDALGETDEVIASRHGLASFINDEASLLVVTMIVFAAFPIFAAARLVRRRGMRLDRTTLRLPFYAQCYPTAVFALGLSIGGSLVDLHPPSVRIAGGLLIGAALVNYGVVQTRWFAAKLRISALHAAGGVLLGLLEGTALMFFIGFLLAG